MGVSELGVACRDEDVASQRQLESTGEAVTVNSSDQRLRERLECVDGLGREVWRWRMLALADRVEIMASAERPTSPFENDATDRRVLGDRVDMGTQLDKRRSAHGVEFLGSVERECGETIGPVTSPNQRVAHRTCPASISTAWVKALVTHASVIAAPRSLPESKLPMSDIGPER